MRFGLSNLFVLIVFSALAVGFAVNISKLPLSTPSATEIPPRKFMNPRDLVLRDSEEAAREKSDFEQRSKDLFVDNRKAMEALEKIKRAKAEQEKLEQEFESGVSSKEDDELQGSSDQTFDK